jgi:hypothetical protein
MDIDIPFSAEDRKRLRQALGSSWNADDVAEDLVRAWDLPPCRARLQSRTQLPALSSSEERQSKLR